MTTEQHTLAMRYAYHFFFRRMIPLPFIHQDGGATFTVAINNKQELKPRKWPGLDVICDGILTGAAFVYKAEALNAPFSGETVAA
jgi:hypothetical protein